MGKAFGDNEKIIWDGIAKDLGCLGNIPVLQLLNIIIQKPIKGLT
jgi:hypothetical protein